MKNKIKVINMFIISLFIVFGLNSIFLSDATNKDLSSIETISGINNHVVEDSAGWSIVDSFSLGEIYALGSDQDNAYVKSGYYFIDEYEISYFERLQIASDYSSLVTEVGYFYDKDQYVLPEVCQSGYIIKVGGSTEYVAVDNRGDCWSYLFYPSTNYRYLFYSEQLESAPNFDGMFFKDVFTSEGLNIDDILKGVTANDEVDGDLTSSIVVIEDNYTSNKNIAGSYTIKLSVSDSAGNVAYAAIIVRVIDDYPPIISGDKSYKSSYTMKIDLDVIKSNLNAVDYMGLDISSAIVISEDNYSSNYNIVGVHSIIFSVTDGLGKSSNIEVLIDVVDVVPPYFSFDDSFTVYVEVGVILTDEDLIFIGADMKGYTSSFNIDNSIINHGVDTSISALYAVDVELKDDGENTIGFITYQVNVGNFTADDADENNYLIYIIGGIGLGLILMITFIFVKRKRSKTNNNVKHRVAIKTNNNSYRSFSDVEKISYFNKILNDPSSTIQDKEKAQRRLKDLTRR